MTIPFQYEDFHGGLNTKDSLFLLKDEESRDLFNVQGTTAGAVIKRTGLTTFATPGTATLQSLYVSEDTASTFLIATGGTAIYSVNGAGTVTQIYTTTTSGLRWEFVSAAPSGGQGPIYAMSAGTGVNDAPVQWAGSGNMLAWTASTGTLPNGKYMTLASNQVYVSGVAATPYRVFVSAINDPRSWDPNANTGANFFDVDPNDGQPITGLGRVGPYVLVTKARKLYVIVDPGSSVTPTVIRRISDGIGCAAHRSIAAGPQGTFFLAEDRGVYETNGSKVTPVSDKIQPTIDSIVSRQNAAGVFYNGHYYLSVGVKGSVNDTTLDYDTALGSWWRHSIGANQWTIWHPTGPPQLYMAKSMSTTWAAAGITPTVSSVGGEIDQAFVPNTWQDNGQNFTWYWRGPWQSPTFYRRRRFPTPYLRKRLRQLRFDGSGRVDLSIAKDFTQTESLIANDLFGYSGTVSNFAASDGSVYGGAGTFGGSPTIGRSRVYGQGVANAFSLVFSATANAPGQLNLYVLEVTDRKDAVVS